MPQVPLAGPSPRQLATTTALALGIAAVILVTIVLPAEYGIDPLGIGETLGLTAMSRPVKLEPLALPEGSDLTPVANGPESQYSAPFKTDSVQFTLGPYDYVEYKYVLDEGAQMQFSWHATALVTHEFHGERVDKPDDATSYDNNNYQAAHGAFTAPFKGIHGWYWENPGDTPITVTLKSSGFYAAAIEFRSDKSRVKHELKAP